MAISDIALDLDPTSPTFGDIVMTNGTLQTVSGKQGILQNVLQTLGVFFGEWFMDNTIGIDYFGQILKRNPDQRTIDAIFIDKILSVNGVTALLSYNFRPDTLNRIMYISFKAQTTDGTVNYSGAVA